MILRHLHSWLYHWRVVLSASQRSSAVKGTGGNMCGIVGYIGSREVSSVLVDGLKRLEYRGYDSCGVAIMDEGEAKLIRSVGRIGVLEEKIKVSAGPTPCLALRAAVVPLGEGDNKNNKTPNYS